jgi:hypothetical protein
VRYANYLDGARAIGAPDMTTSPFFMLSGGLGTGSPAGAARTRRPGSCSAAHGTSEEACWT